VLDFRAASNGSLIIYAVRNETGGTDIWKRNRSGENKELVHSCREFICTNLAVDPFGKNIAFTSQDPDGGLSLISISDSLTVFFEKGNISNIDFSPNGKYLRYFQNNIEY